MSDRVPTGVKVIAVLYYIGAVFGILLGILFLISTKLIEYVKNQNPLVGAVVVGAGVKGMVVLLGIVFIGFGILNFFIGRGLWRGRNWARIVAIIFSILGILGSIISMVQGKVVSNIFNLVIGLIIGGYLLFNKNVKEAFT